MSQAQTGDYFDRARSVAASVLFAAGAAAIIGAVLDWVTVEERPPNVPSGQLDRLPPLTGIEVEDGWYVIGAAGIILGSAFFIVLRGQALYSWLAFLASMIIGAIAVADYRDVDGLLSEAEGIGRGPRPGVGLLLVAAAAFVGMAAAVAGVAASPSRPVQEG
jgi:hypothetical protein